MERSAGEGSLLIWARGPLVSCCGRDCGRTGSLKSTESGRDELKKSEAEETTRTCSEPGRAATDLSLGLGQSAPRRRAESLTLHFERLTLPADSGVTAASLAGLNLSPQPGFSRALRRTV